LKRRNESLYLVPKAQHLANLKQFSIEGLADITTKNATQLFESHSK
jgi:Tat protein secretion system quality control protein TatD with DNase activity